MFYFGLAHLLFLGVSDLFCCFYSVLMEISTTVDPDQMPHNLANDLGLHYLPVTLLRVSRVRVG